MNAEKNTTDIKTVWSNLRQALHTRYEKDDVPQKTIISVFLYSVVRVKGYKQIRSCFVCILYCILLLYK